MLNRYFKFLLFVFVFAASKTTVAIPLKASDSTATDNVQTEKRSLVQRIELEKTRIAADYKSADQNLFVLIDSVTHYVLDKNISEQKEIKINGKVKTVCSDCRWKMMRLVENR